MLVARALKLLVQATKARKDKDISMVGSYVNVKISSPAAS